MTIVELLGLKGKTHRALVPIMSGKALMCGSEKLPDILAFIEFSPTYLPLTQETQEYLAMMLSGIACELLKGEHANTRLIDIQANIHSIS